MTTEPERFTKAEIEEFARGGWQIGPPLNWRKYTRKIKPNDTDQPHVEDEPAQTLESKRDEQD